MIDLSKSFHQEGNVLTVRYLTYKTKFLMPDYFDINSVSDDLKRLSLIVLFYPIDKSLIDYTFTRDKAGDNIGLAFSGGVDSTAAYALLPKHKTLLFHHKRIINGKSMYKHDNPLFVIDNLPDNVAIIESDLEDIRVQAGRGATGFLNDLSFFGGYLLLSDHLQLGYLSTGMMLESTYAYKGYEYRDFHNSNYFNFWFDLFERANLPLFFPCIPCSEVLTSKIVKENKLTSQSCIRGVNGEGCNRCYKCFRKNLLNGILLEDYKESNEIVRFLTTRPLKQGASLIYAMNKGKFNISELAEYSNLCLSWLENYFEYTLLSIPEEYRHYMRGQLSLYANPGNIKHLENFSL